MEEELTKKTEENTDQIYEIRRLTHDKEKLEQNLQNVQKESIKNQGDSQTSGATIARLQAQLNGQKNDVELFIN